MLILIFSGPTNVEDMNALLIKDACMLNENDLETFISSVGCVCFVAGVMLGDLGYKDI